MDKSQYTPRGYKNGLSPWEETDLQRVGGIATLYGTVMYYRGPKDNTEYLHAQRVEGEYQLWSTRDNEGEYRYKGDFLGLLEAWKKELRRG